MVKLAAFVWVLACVMGIAGCGGRSPKPVSTIVGMRTYYEMSDGTWQSEGYTYEHRLVISGRMPNAAKDTTYVYLSNIEEISFENAMMASGISSNSEDYFGIEDAVLVEIY